MAKSHYEEVQETIDDFEQPQQAIEITANTGNVRDKLPMLFTTRGKLIKNPNKKRVSGLNAASLMNDIDAVRHSENNIVLQMEDYKLTMYAILSQQLRDSGLIAEIMLGGYTLKV